MRVEVASLVRSLGQKLIDEKVILPVAVRAGHTHVNGTRGAYTRRGAPPARVSGTLALPGGISWSIPTPFARYPSFVRPMALQLPRQGTKRLPGKTFRQCVCIWVCVLGAIMDGPGRRNSKKCCCLWRIDRSMASHGKLCRCILFPPLPLSPFLLLLPCFFLLFYFVSLSLLRSASMLVKTWTRVFVCVHVRVFTNFYNFFLKNCKNEERFYLEFCYYTQWKFVGEKVGESRKREAVNVPLNGFMGRFRGRRFINRNDEASMRTAGISLLLINRM